MQPKNEKTTPRASFNLTDRLIRWIAFLAACLVLILVLALLIVLVRQSWLSIRTNGSVFFTSRVWDPAEEHRVFGALAFIYGTVVTSFLAMLIAVPLGIGTAAYLSEIAPTWIRVIGSFLVEMLAAVPSVVYGFWALQVLGPYLQECVRFLGGPNFGGVGIFPAGIILAIMIVPYVTAVSFDVCRSVPTSQREGALALGATRWQMIWSVVLPYARPGIIAACFIALGRAVGETMAVTMIIGNSGVIRFSVFAKGDTIASVIGNQFSEATYDLYRSALVQLALVLFLVTLAVNAVARLLLSRIGTARRMSRTPFWRLRRPILAIATPKKTKREELHLPAVAKRNRKLDRIMTFILGLCLVVTLGPLFLILGYLLVQGAGALSWNFFVQLPKPVGEPGGGMANGLVGSAVLVGMATLFAVPIGLLAAIYLVEFRDRWFTPLVRFVAELLAGVPSIVIGIFAYVVVIQTSKEFVGRPSWFGIGGIFALAVMMIPIVLRASEEALKLVPSTLRQASYALGAGHGQTLARVVIPAALPSIVTAVFLAIARIVGETAPLLMTASMNQYWPRSLSDYTPSIPLYVYQYAMSGSEDWRRQAWAAAFVLLALVMSINIAVRLVTGKRQVEAGRAD